MRFMTIKLEFKVIATCQVLLYCVSLKYVCKYAYTRKTSTHRVLCKDKHTRFQEYCTTLKKIECRKNHDFRIKNNFFLQNLAQTYFYLQKKDQTKDVSLILRYSFLKKNFEVKSLKSNLYFEKNLEKSSVFAKIMKNIEKQASFSSQWNFFNAFFINWLIFRSWHV